MKQFDLSRVAESLQPSGIRKFFDLAASMKGVISLGVGEPDFVTPWNVRQACIRSLEQGYTSYTANAGLLELRQEIAKYLKKQFAVSYDPNDEIIVTVGASQALDVAMRAIVLNCLSFSSSNDIRSELNLGSSNFLFLDLFG